MLAVTQAVAWVAQFASEVEVEVVVVLLSVGCFAGWEVVVAWEPQVICRIWCRSGRCLRVVVHNIYKT